MPRTDSVRSRTAALIAMLCGGLLTQGCAGGPAPRPSDASASPVRAEAEALEPATTGADEASGSVSDADVRAACTTLHHLTEVEGAIQDADLESAEALTHEMGGLLDELAARVRASGRGPTDATFPDALEEAANLLRDLADLSAIERTQGVQPDAHQTAELLRRLGHAQVATADLGLWEHENCTGGLRVQVGEIAGIPWMHAELDEEPDLRHPAWTAADEVNDGW